MFLHSVAKYQFTGYLPTILQFVPETIQHQPASNQAVTNLLYELSLIMLFLERSTEEQSESINQFDAFPEHVQYPHQ